MAINCRDGRCFLTARVRCSADVHSVNDYAFTFVDAPHTRISVAVNFEFVIESRGRSPTPKLAVTVMPSCREKRIRRFYQQTIQRLRKEFSWMVGMRAFGASHALSSALSHSAPSTLLQPGQNAWWWREVLRDYHYENSCYQNAWKTGGKCMEIWSKEKRVTWGRVEEVHTTCDFLEWHQYKKRKPIWNHKDKDGRNDARMVYEMDSQNWTVTHDASCTICLVGN